MPGLCTVQTKINRNNGGFRMDLLRLRQRMRPPPSLALDPTLSLHRRSTAVGLDPVCLKPLHPLGLDRAPQSCNFPQGRPAPPKPSSELLPCALSVGLCLRDRHATARCHVGSAANVFALRRSAVETDVGTHRHD